MRGVPGMSTERTGQGHKVAARIYIYRVAVVSSESDWQESDG